ncbi:urea amidolyase family protein [Isoptericola sp. BMS4]|uniref:5-oxoprolinase subunit B/C family protein n=1 Tax=Isoptericola sp. BMS4 TaxID=2527875 RepID=UPI00142311AD|nr:urea amidolyase family protein [Isoptericola sp. BMS4]
MRVRRARDDVLLVELDDLAHAVALHARLRADPVPGVGETVPGARTLLVSFDPWRVDAAGLAGALRALAGTVARAPDVAEGGGRLVEVPTVYDGADLDEVARLLGCGTDALVRRHTAAAWTVGFVGFAPGFAYLTGDDPGLSVPRRATPRTRVPAGAVAMAGPWSGVYPRESPGGWQLVGRTDVVTWDAERDPPTPWAPGDRVRFVAVRPRARAAPRDQVGSPGSGRQSGLPTRSGTADGTGGAGLEVLASGMQTLVQDLGRPGLAHLGVSASGAADPRSLRAANRAVGNPPGTAALEAVGGGLRIRARGPLVVALAGADPGAVVHQARVEQADERADPVPVGRALRLADGDELALGAPARGWRTYVAVRGGLDVPPVLGSRSTDVLSGLGPAPLAPGTRVRCGYTDGRESGRDARRLRTHSRPEVLPGAVATDDVGAPDPAALPAPGEVATLPVVLGPHDDWFDAAATRLGGQDWEVTPRSDRVGLRLDGARPLDRAPSSRDRELPSEGCVTGALQVPPDGRPVLFGVDHPLTGGYPVVGAVAATHLWLLGQLPPGTLVRLRPTVVGTQMA